MHINPHLIANLHVYPTYGSIGGTANLSGDSKTLSSFASNTNFTGRSAKAKSSGKWYGEFAVGGLQYSSVGIVNASASLATFVGGDVNGYGFAEVYDLPNPGDIGAIYNNGAVLFSPAAHITANMGIALDLVSNVIYWYGNGSLITSTSIAAGTYYLAWGGYQGAGASETGTINCGPSTTYSPPAGYERWYW